MWVFQVQYMDKVVVRKLIKGGRCQETINETKGIQYIVAGSLQEVYERIKEEMAMDGREWIAIVRHMPICQII